ncbi:MAG: glycine betaine ABC transporter substrate-binding protein [Streptosporangiales bacterium]
MPKTLTRRQLLGRTSAAMVGAYLVGGTGYGIASGASGAGALSLGSIGWTENIAVSNLTKAMLEDDLGYDEVPIMGPLDLGPLFAGVAGGDLSAFQDVWLPNNKQYLNKVHVKNSVKVLKPWYESKTSYGIAVPDYMDVQSLADLNKAKTDKIIGIEPGASFMPVIRNKVIPAYNLDMKLLTSSTTGMLTTLKRKYANKEPIVFVAWSPHWMNTRYDFHYLKDPKDAQGIFNNPSRITSVVNDGLRRSDPVAYTFLTAISLDEHQINQMESEIKKAGSDEPIKGVRNWLKSNRKVVQPWIDKAKKAQRS